MPLLKNHLTILCESISRLYSIPLICVSILLPILYCLYYHGCIVSLKIGYVSSLNFVVLQYYLAILVLFFFFHQNFRISLSTSTKYLRGILIGIVLNTLYKMKNINILIILRLLTHDTEYLPHLFCSSMFLSVL